MDEASDTSDTGQSDVADASFECNAVDVDRPDGSPVCNGTVPVHLEGLCAWFTDGHAKCWSAEFLQHVDGGAEDASTSKDIPLSGVIELVMGHGHACALLQDHTVWCWGRNDSGQLGDGTRVEHSTPEPVPGLTNVVQIVASSESTCARIDDGTLRCWGGDDYGQLGDGVWRPYVEMAGTSNIRPTPIEVPGLSGVVDVSMNQYNTCAVLRDSTVVCWGELLHDSVPSAPNGQVELGANTPTLIARTRDAALEGVKKVIAGEYTITYGVLNDGNVVFWGEIHMPAVSNFASPVAVARPELFGAIDIEGRWALLRSGSVLRDNVRLPFDRCVVAISEVNGHACMGLDDGTVGCWDDEPEPHFVVLP